MSLWFDWQAAQNGALLKVVRRRSFRGDAARAEISGYDREDKGKEDVPRRANDLRFNVSSCMAGSSERISPFAS
jgi:hypothetical protein